MWAALLLQPVVAAADTAVAVAGETMPAGSLGDYTGPAGLVGLLVLTLDRFGLLRNDSKSATLSAEAAERFVRLEEQSAALRRDVDACRAAAERTREDTQRSLDEQRRDTADRLDRLRDAVRRELDA